MEVTVLRSLYDGYYYGGPYIHGPCYISPCYERPDIGTCMEVLVMEVLV